MGKETQFFEWKKHLINLAEYPTDVKRFEGKGLDVILRDSSLRQVAIANRICVRKRVFITQTPGEINYQHETERTMPCGVYKLSGNARLERYGSNLFSHAPCAACNTVIHQHSVQRTVVRRRVTRRVSQKERKRKKKKEKLSPTAVRAAFAFRARNIFEIPRLRHARTRSSH